MRASGSASGLWLCLYLTRDPKPWVRRELACEAAFSPPHAFPLCELHQCLEFFNFLPASTLDSRTGCCAASWDRPTTDAADAEEVSSRSEQEETQSSLPLEHCSCPTIPYPDWKPCRMRFANKGNKG